MGKQAGRNSCPGNHGHAVYGFLKTNYGYRTSSTLPPQTTACGKKFPWQKDALAIHIKDTLPGVIRRVPFGKGTVDFLDAFKVIKKSGFFGPLLVEMWAEEGADNTGEAEKARLFVLGKMAKAWENK